LIVRDPDVELSGRIGGHERLDVERDDRVRDAALADRRVAIVVHIVIDESVDRDGEGEQELILVA